MVKFGTAIFSDIGQRAVDYIIDDAKQGIFQNGKRKQKYKSKSYKKYKANNMRRFTDGKKLKGFKNQSTNTNTSFVDMELTGFTFDSITTNAKENTAVIVFNNGAVVEGNAKRGYDIFNLRNKNLNALQKRLGKILDRNVRKFARIKEVIKI